VRANKLHVEGIPFVKYLLSHDKLNEPIVNCVRASMLIEIQSWMQRCRQLLISEGEKLKGVNIDQEIYQEALGVLAIDISSVRGNDVLKVAATVKSLIEEMQESEGSQG
jgi:hypothetical protein